MVRKDLGTVAGRRWAKALLALSIYMDVSRTDTKVSAGVVDRRNAMKTKAGGHAKPGKRQGNKHVLVTCPETLLRSHELVIASPFNAGKIRELCQKH